MKIGYARASTSEQNLTMQVIAPEEAGCENISESCEVEQPKFARLMKSCWADRQQRPAIDAIAQSDCFINPY